MNHNVTNTTARRSSRFDQLKTSGTLVAVKSGAQLSSDVLDGMVKAIVREVGPERIVLFGSRARGQGRPDSDVDLLVVETKPFDPKWGRRGELKRVRNSLCSFRMAKDIFVYTRDEVQRWKNARNHVIAVALREGRLLYERPSVGMNPSKRTCRRGWQ